MSQASDTKEGLRATLRDLVALHGVSGFEQPLVTYFQKRVAGLADQVDVDRYGNVTAVRRGRHERPA
jgi:putative aminopeptidase